MMKSRTGLAVVAMIFALAVPAMAQEKEKEHQFRVDLTMESYEADLEISGSSNNFGSTTLETDIESTLRGSGTFLSGVYDYNGLDKMVISGHLSLGVEDLSNFSDVGPGNEFGSPAGTRRSDVIFDASFAWEIGGSFKYVVDPKFDVLGTLSFRGGSAEKVDDFDKITYDYTRFRIGVEGGYKAMEGVRPFLGLRYTLYDAELKVSEKIGTDVYSFDFEYDMPVGLTLGADLGKGPLAARVEVDLLDSLGFLATVGYKF